MHSRNVSSRQENCLSIKRKPSSCREPRQEVRSERRQRYGDGRDHSGSGRPDYFDFDIQAEVCGTDRMVLQGFIPKNMKRKSMRQFCLFAALTTIVQQRRGEEQHV